MAIFGFRNKPNKLNVNCNLFYYFNGEDNTGSPRKQGKSDLLCFTIIFVTEGQVFLAVCVFICLLKDR